MPEDPYQDLIDQVRTDFPLSSPPTTQEVIDILRFIGKPGKNREAKNAVIDALFTDTNSQGIGIARAIKGYVEY